MTTHSDLKIFKPLALLALLFIYNLAIAETLDTIIAVVDDDVVMASELNRKIKRVKDEAAQRGVNLPPDSDLKKQVLERLIVMKVQLHLADRAGIKIDDNMLNRAISNIAAENGMSLENFRKTIENEGFDFIQFREDIRDEITLSQLRKREVDNRVFVSDREVKNYLATQSQQGNDVEEFHLQHILIAFPENADEDLKEATAKKASEVLEKLKAGADFSTVAKEVSASGNAAGGGDMGWMEARKVPTLFSSILPNMNKGDLSELIKNGSGYHIIKLVDKRSSDIQMIDQTHARHILIRTNELTSDEDAMTKLQQLKDRIEAGADFADLARSHSDDKASAAKGGDLGWVSPGDMIPAFEKEMNAISDGEISAPFKTQFGWHIVQVLGHRQYDGTKELTLARARAAVKKRKVEEEYQSWLIRLRDEAYVEYR